MKKASYYVEHNTLLPVAPVRMPAPHVERLTLFDRWAIFAGLTFLCVVIASAKGFL